MLIEFSERQTLYIGVFSPQKISPYDVVPKPFMLKINVNLGCIWEIKKKS